MNRIYRMKQLRVISVIREQTHQHAVTNIKYKRSLMNRIYQ